MRSWLPRLLQGVWEAKVGETLPSEREQRNARDRYAVRAQPVKIELIIRSSKNFVS